MRLLQTKQFLPNKRINQHNRKHSCGIEENIDKLCSSYKMHIKIYMELNNSMAKE
jgi:hypothetical protein